MFIVEFDILWVDVFVGLFCGSACFDWADILLLTLKAPSKIAADDTLIIFNFIFQENKV